METLMLLAVGTLATVVPQLIHLASYFSVCLFPHQFSTIITDHPKFGAFTLVYTFYRLYNLSEILTAE